MTLANVRPLFGTAPSVAEIRQFGGLLPDGRMVVASELPVFVEGKEYVLFLRNTKWNVSPVVGDLALRVEAVEGNEVLVNSDGQAITGIGSAGLTVGPALFEGPKLDGTVPQALAGGLSLAAGKPLDRNRFVSSLRAAMATQALTVAGTFSERPAASSSGVDNRQPHRLVTVPPRYRARRTRAPELTPLKNSVESEEIVMNTKTRTGVRSAIALAAVCAMTGAAEAASWRTCNGSPVIWRGTLNIHRNRCSIPDSGLVNSSYWNGMRQWDRVSTVVDGTFVNAASDCSIGHGDGENEVGLVNRSAIDGANGMTILQLGVCFIGSNDIDEADVMIANDLSFTPQNGDFRGTTGRSTLRPRVRSLLRLQPRGRACSPAHDPAAPHYRRLGTIDGVAERHDRHELGVRLLDHASESAAVCAWRRRRIGADARPCHHGHDVPRQLGNDACVSRKLRERCIGNLLAARPPEYDGADGGVFAEHDRGVELHAFSRRVHARDVRSAVQRALVAVEWHVLHLH